MAEADQVIFRHAVMADKIGKNAQAFFRGIREKIPEADDGADRGIIIRKSRKNHKIEQFRACLFGPEFPGGRIDPFQQPDELCRSTGLFPCGDRI